MDFSVAFGFGGRPLGFAAGFLFGGGTFFGTASVSLSEELSGEKMLFFLDESDKFFAAFDAVLESGAVLELVFCICCCLTTDGGAFPPVICGADEAAAFFMRALGANAFFLISFWTRFASACWAFVGVVSSSLE